ncbi:MAG TPA: dual specificity protein phosphatase family protein [Planctomycetota bacterium]|nr:dual specificity protein phosphatase family protein [Planctomycetota bacterium]
MKPFSLRSFTVIVPGKLAVMSRPGLYGTLEEDLAFLRGNQIGAIVSLTTSPLQVDAVRAVGMEYLHEAIPDFTAPTPGQLDRIMDFIVRQADAAGRMVLVHCGAGLGRSGTVAASYLVRQGWEPRRAIARVRELRPFSIETEEQELAVVDYAARLRGQIN